MVKLKPPSQTTSQNDHNKSKPNRLLFVILSLLASIVLVFGVISWWYISSFEQASHTSTRELMSHALAGWDQPLPETNNHTNILLLGLDQKHERDENSLLTDTIMIISVADDGNITTLSLPRDLWINALKTKINAIYYYGEINEGTSGEELTRVMIEEITGLSIHFTIIMKMETVSSFINTLENITVNVENDFVDTKYPRDDVPPDIEPEILRYETVEFHKGEQQFDGTTALKYIRSRQSTNQEEGTDPARSERQRQVLNAIILRLKSKEVLSDPNLLGSVYRIWRDEIITDITISHIASFARLFITSPPEIHSISIPIAQNDKKGIIFHPLALRNGHWIYEPLDPSWTELKDWIRNNLN